MTENWLSVTIMRIVQYNDWVVFTFPPNVKFLYNSLVNPKKNRIPIYKCVSFHHPPQPKTKRTQTNPNRCASKIANQMGSFPQIFGDEHEKHVKFHHPGFGWKGSKLRFFFLPRAGISDSTAEAPWERLKPRLTPNCRSPRAESWGCVSGCLGGWIPGGWGDSGWLGWGKRCLALILVYHLERWRSPLPPILLYRGYWSTFWEWLAIYFHYGVVLSWSCSCSLALGFGFCFLLYILLFKHNCWNLTGLPLDPVKATIYFEDATFVFLDHVSRIQHVISWNNGILPRIMAYKFAKEKDPCITYTERVHIPELLKMMFLFPSFPGGYSCSGTVAAFPAGSGVRKVANGRHLQKRLKKIRKKKCHDPCYLKFVSKLTWSLQPQFE